MACMALFAFSCSENEMDGSISPDRQTFLQMSLNNFGHEKPLSTLQDSRITKIDAYIFDNGILTEAQEDLTADNGLYELPIKQRAGTLYLIGNAPDKPMQEIGNLTETDFLQFAIDVSDVTTDVQFFTGEINLAEYNGYTIPLTVKRGVARLDLRIRTTGNLAVTDVVIKNAAQKTYVFPQSEVRTPDGTEKKDMVRTFGEGLKQDSAGIFYLCEQNNPDLSVYVKAEMDGKMYEMEQALPDVVKRNTVYTVTVRKDLTGVGLDIEEWNTGEGTELTPSLDSRLTVDQTLSELTEGVQVTDEGTTLVFPHRATEVLLAVDCDDELELLPLNGYPLTVEPAPQTRGLEGKNLFRIRKALYAPGMPTDETTLQFHRKGLDNSYPEDRIRLVLQANPVEIEGLMTFDAETYTHRFDRYIDNELGAFTLPEGKQLSVEFEEGEDPWLKLERREGTDNIYRVLAGWKPNDPTANGRVQEGRLVISHTDGSQREEYVVSRRNYGLPVTWLHGVWWCKYNAKGNSRSFDDQVLSSADPAVQAGQTAFQYLESCTAEEYYDLWGWAYQGDSGQGLRVVNQNGTAVLDGFQTGQTVHMNKLAPTALAPDGYEVPSMEEFNRLFDATDYVWVMWSGSHVLKNPWEGHSKILREQKRRNDVTVDGLAVSDLIYVAMKSPDFPQFEPVVWYGPAAQWNASGIYHGHYNNILFTVYEPGGKGWYFNGSMAGLYLTQNGAGNNDTHILRFKKSPVEYIYGTDLLP